MIAPKEKVVKPKAKNRTEEIQELITEMVGLWITDPPYRTLYVKLSLLVPEQCKYYKSPIVYTAESYPTWEPQNLPNGLTHQDLPPHQTMPTSDQWYGERCKPTCYRCGEWGHRMDQCAGINAFITQDIVKRIEGRLRWADGLSIIREPDETWVNAVSWRVQQDWMTWDAKQSVYLSGNMGLGWLSVRPRGNPQPKGVLLLIIFNAY